ncbi:MAG TPA: HD domain-containing phosphohydrolase, partial [Clostridia bacterium]
LTDAFYDILLKSIISIVLTGKINPQEKVSGLVATCSDEGEYNILSAEGEFADQVGNSLFYVIDEKDESYNRLKCEGCFFSKRNVAFRFKSEMNPEVIVYIKSMHDFSEMERDLLLVFYSNVSISFSNMDLSNEIESTQKEILYTLGGIAEARSRELGQHVLRVAEYAKIIALGYGLPEDEAELIKQAAPMHDIGKIAILDQILIKPGRLTTDEFEVMKTHSNLGYDLLKNSNRKTLKAAAIIALQHHEKYNGEGYPNGLKGEEIHIYGRIVAVADVFDALGCDRVYKKAWELEKILDYFKQESGKHFDPVLVEILFEKLDLILKVKNTLPD